MDGCSFHGVGVLWSVADAGGGGVHGHAAVCEADVCYQGR